MAAGTMEPTGQGWQMRELLRDGMREVFVTQVGAMPGSLVATAQHLGQALAARVAAAEVFAPELHETDRAAAQSLLSRAQLPLTWVHGGAAGNGLGGAHLQAIVGAQVRPLALEGHPVGLAVSDSHAVEVMLSGIHDPDTTAPPAVQARRTFERLEQALALADMDFSHVVRTWLFLDDILSWYDDFNRVRTAFFTERGVFDGLVPASTGIGAGNPLGAALVAGAYAVKPLSPQATVQPLPSPLQSPALQYGSSFSRAVEVAMPDLQRLLVSGTASIAPDGRTVHVDNLPGQVARTCEVIAALLESRGMNWGDVTRATAYVRRAEDEAAFERYRTTHGLPELPVVVAHAVICRDDLLFELEVDAVRGRAPFPPTATPPIL